MKEPDKILLQYLTQIFSSCSLEEAILQLYAFLQKYMDFYKLTLYMVDSHDNSYSPWLIIEEGEIHYHNFSSKLRTALRDLPTDYKNNAYIENDLKNAAFIVPLRNSPARSLLALTLYTQNTLMVSLNLQSLAKNQFTQEHAEILELFRIPLQRMMENFFATYTGISTDFSLNVFQNSYELIKQCKGLKQVRSQVESVAQSHVPVLILGETGVGKELVADSIHYLSGKPASRIIKVNCASLTENLMDSELFGHEKGAFTGAASVHIGYFEQAQNSTLFLDEIGELSLTAQAKILRVVQNREIRRVGGTNTYVTNARFIFATNRDIAKLAEEGKFRQDLLYRLAIFPIVVPPLRNRKEDIPVLVHTLYAKKVEELGMLSPPALTDTVIHACYKRIWKGNVRELEHLIERSLLTSKHAGRKTLCLDEAGAHQTSSAKQTFDIQKSRIEEALFHCKGRIQGEHGAAQYLGINPNTLRSQMKKLGIPVLLKEREIYKQAMP